MMRSMTYLALASSAVAFQSMSSKPAFVPNTALHMTPYYASSNSVTLEEPKTESKTKVEEPSANIPPAPVAEAPKKVPKKAPKKGGPAHKEGVFSPMVTFVKGVLGDQTLNKVRGKVISLHSDVIGTFVETSESAFGDAVLRSLFRLADKDGNGTICKEELQTALHSLGFNWLQDKQVEGIFKRADVDENGAIDMDEWIKEAPKTLRTNLVKLAKKNGGDMGLLV